MLGLVPNEGDRYLVLPHVIHPLFRAIMPAKTIGTGGPEAV